MGLLSKLFGKKDKGENEKTVAEEKSSIKRGMLNGKDFFEFYDKDIKPGQRYDTTRVVLDRHYTNDELGTFPCNIYVSWYSETDESYMDPSIRELRKQYTHVIAEIDPSILKDDDSYAEELLKKLLEKNRVEAFMETALKTQEELSQIVATYKDPNEAPTYLHPHGLYVGGVSKRKNGSWGKCFDVIIGGSMHETIELQQQRAQLRKNMEDRRKERIERNQAEIARLQAEIDSMGEQSEYDVR